MCGILGEKVFNSNQLVDRKIFQSLLRLSKSRGPDSSGYYSNETNLQLGFNRLAILDPSINSNQPIISPSGRYIMVFNGEIYNYFELRQLLPSKKINFKGNGDTETLIACFDHFGVLKTVEKLNGMFAIGIYDKLKEEISLIRDIAGIKPLHYGFDNNRLVFGSQYDQISMHPNFYQKGIQADILKLYLTQHFIPSPFNLLKNTYSVNPGEIVSFDKIGNKKSSFYWTFPAFGDYNQVEENIIEEIEEELLLTVKSELMSDVPLGAFLSGGVDSPIICYLIKKNIRKKFNTFTMGSDSFVHDETSLAREYSKCLDTMHNEININAKTSLEILDQSVYSSRAPFGDFSILPTWMVSKLARKNVKVCLSGDGADELFFGYERFKSIGKNYNFWGFPYYIRYALRGLDKLLYSEKNINECILASDPGEAHMGLHNRFPATQLYSIAPYLEPVCLPEKFRTYNYKNPSSLNELLHNMRKAEFYGMLQKTLMKVDSASMAHGLEVRVPFLNKNFIERILKIQIGRHQAHKDRKFLLYKYLNKIYPNILPQKTKKGFSISLTNWIKKDFQAPFKEKLLDTKFCNSFGFDKTKIENMISDHILDKSDYKWPLFSLYSLCLWNYNGRKSIEEM